MSARGEPAVDAEVAAMKGAAALPRRNGELVFDAPWQGRAFGLALTLVQRLGLPWREFQKHLIDVIAAQPGAPYYESWVAALERLVLERGLATTEELARAVASVRAAPR
ncbi:MAG: nitrile hydratase accessory protein [Thermodesulfobacteriota bacterium]